MELPLSAMPNRITVIHKTWLPRMRQPRYFSIFIFPTFYSPGVFSFPSTSHQPRAVLPLPVIPHTLKVS